MVTADLDAQRRILNRLKRASGQLTAVIAAVESGGNCREVVTQLSAVSSAILSSTAPASGQSNPTRAARF